MATPTTRTELLQTVEKELIKQHQALDSFGRPEFLYTAPVYAKSGDNCLVTEFLYVDNVSSTLKGKKEGYSLWSVDFIPDSDFTVATVQISKTQQIMTNEKELTKQYQELDGQGRPSKVYEAPVTAIDGTPCLVTEYIYQSPTSTIFLGKKESYSVWDTSWVPDSSFTVSY